MTHKESIEKELKQKNFILGNYDNKLETISKYTLKKIIGAFHYESTDIDITINRKKYVVEVSVVDNEVDFNILSKDEYISRYGDERWSN